MVLKRVYCGESLAQLRPVHRVKVILFQMCGFCDLDMIMTNLKEYLIPFHFFHLALWLCGFVGP